MRSSAALALVVPISLTLLATQSADAQQVAPECRYDAAASSTTPNPVVQRDEVILLREGAWTANTAGNRGDVFFNGVRGNTYTGAPIQLNVATGRAQFHFDLDVGQAGFSNSVNRGTLAGWCNTQIRNTSLLDRGELTLTTLDVSITEQNGSVNRWNNPQRLGSGGRLGACAPI